MRARKVVRKPDVIHEGFASDLVPENDEDDEDEFVTPDSSPGAQTPPRNPTQPNIAVSQSQAGEEVRVSETLVKKKMYDRYQMSMNGMQVSLN